MFPAAQSPAMIGTAFLVLVLNPKRNTDIRRDKKFTGENNNRFHFVILDQFSSNFQSITVTQCAIRQKEPRNAV